MDITNLDGGRTWRDVPSRFQCTAVCFGLLVGNRIELIIHPVVVQETYSDTEDLITAVETTIGASIQV